MDPRNGKCSRKDIRHHITQWRNVVKKKYEARNMTGGGALEPLADWEQALNNLRLGGRKTHKVGKFLTFSEESAEFDQLFPFFFSVL